MLFEPLASLGSAPSQTGASFALRLRDDCGRADWLSALWHAVFAQGELCAFFRPSCANTGSSVVIRNLFHFVRPTMRDRQFRVGGCLRGLSGLGPDTGMPGPECFMVKQG
jgi:hypothetical protein